MLTFDNHQNIQPIEIYKYLRTHHLAFLRLFLGTVLEASKAKKSDKLLTAKSDTQRKLSESIDYLNQQTSKA